MASNRGLKGRCTNKDGMGIECGNTDNLLPNRNLCRSCKSDINREYKKNGPKRNQPLYHQEGYQLAAFANNYLRLWRRVV